MQTTDKQGGRTMPKDSQPDNKVARMEKCNGQTPITRENQNKNPNAKHKSIKHNDVQILGGVFQIVVWNKFLIISTY